MKSTTSPRLLSWLSCAIIILYLRFLGPFSGILDWRPPSSELAGVRNYDSRVDPSIPVIKHGPCDVTFVTVPKPQTEDRQIQRTLIVLAEWLSFSNSRVVLTSERAIYDPDNKVIPRLEKIFGLLNNRVLFTGELPTGYDDRPLVREWLRVGRQTVKQGYVCFLNSDIVVSSKFMTAAMRIFNSLKMNETMIFGVRNDVESDDALYNLDISSPTFARDLHEHCERYKTGNNPYGMDLFMIHSSMREWDYDDFPGYVVGLCVWDNSFISWANHNFQTVTTNFNPTIYHVSHGGNKCNDENYRYFRAMAARWHVSPRFQVHRDAIWRLDYNSENLRSRRGKTVALKPIEELPGSCNYV